MAPGQCLTDDLPADTAAALLLGACVQRSFAWETSPDRRPPEALDDFARNLARTLLQGIGPTTD
ncbi:MULTISPECIES: hypothetical protein [unclassified Streptomyces]|uniref:hypothetical protein n=1 Tax=unclassified Streptomyces TaxID=2593676 RepID=UPI0016605EA1